MQAIAFCKASFCRRFFAADFLSLAAARASRERASSACSVAGAGKLFCATCLRMILGRRHEIVNRFGFRAKAEVCVARGQPKLWQRTGHANGRASSGARWLCASRRKHSKQDEPRNRATAYARAYAEPTRKPAAFSRKRAESKTLTNLHTWKSSSLASK